MMVAQALFFYADDGSSCNVAMAAPQCKKCQAFMTLMDNNQGTGTITGHPSDLLIYQCQECNC